MIHLHIYIVYLMKKKKELSESVGSAWNNEWNLVFTNELVNILSKMLSTRLLNALQGL